MSPFARKVAAENLAKVIIGTSALLAIAKAVDPDSIELDPRSTDFGKLKIGNTRVNISGGMASIVTLAARVVPSLWGAGGTKSSTTGIFTPFSSDQFGRASAVDIVINFIEGKSSPAFRVFLDHLKGKDFQGKKPTIVGDMVNLFSPLPFTNAYELYSEPNAAPLLLGLILDGLGAGTNTYSGKVDWSSKTGVELMQFRDKVGDEQFKEANRRYNEKYNAWFESVRYGDKYKNLPDEDKTLLLQNKRQEVKDSVFKEYHFKYKKSEHKLPKL
jgi:hypothetical protein